MIPRYVVAVSVLAVQITYLILLVSETGILFFHARNIRLLGTFLQIACHRHRFPVQLICSDPTRCTAAHPTPRQRDM